MPISLPGPTFKKGDLVYYKGSTLGDADQDLWRIVTIRGERIHNSKRKNGETEKSEDCARQTTHKSEHWYAASLASRWK